MTLSYDWTDPQNPLLWQDAVKTLFDPCPPGWRVPKSGEEVECVWNAFTVENGQWQEEDATENGDGYGYIFGAGVVYGGSAWLPVCGYRTAPEGYVRTVMHNGYFRTTTSAFRSPQQMSFAFGFYKSDTERPGLHHRGHGFSVRCIRE